MTESALVFWEVVAIMLPSGVYHRGIGGLHYREMCASDGRVEYLHHTALEPQSCHMVPSLEHVGPPSRLRIEELWIVGRRPTTSTWKWFQVSSVEEPIPQEPRLCTAELGHLLLSSGEEGKRQFTNGLCGCPVSQKTPLQA